jgi:hypothetical protein
MRSSASPSEAPDTGRAAPGDASPAQPPPPADSEPERSESRSPAGE